MEPGPAGKPGAGGERDEGHDVADVEAVGLGDDKGDPPLPWRVTGHDHDGGNDTQSERHQRRDGGGR